MEAFALAMRKTFRYSLWCMALFVILMIVLPEHKVFLQSLVLGTVTGIINTSVLASKVWVVGQMADDPNIRPKGTGTMLRFMIAGLAAYTTFLFPHMFTLSGVLLGVFLIQGISYLLVFRNSK
ncbi:ATP synthase subunit I [Brevibacillus sp. AG]|uniref:ATP synthase subunit I n=1 Tax=Brevibacillus sp. AG TaxID=3020891 RepID=UPI000853667D|nr:ATP synthase subunit I [Brevibacillus sp. AG]MDC0761596.1 ATP synthase subunit I [Brevibacillus sp. AG]